MTQNLFKITGSNVNDTTKRLDLDFGAPAANTDIVAEVTATAKAEIDSLGGGRTLLINGRASLPVAFVICHWAAHVFTQIAVFDPKLQGFVVAISHGGEAPGTLLAEDGSIKA